MGTLWSANGMKKFLFPTLGLFLMTPLSFAQKFRGSNLRDQGYFDLGIGSELIQDVEFNMVENLVATTKKYEYNPGFYLETSAGVSYKNGLGLGLSYSFAYNSLKDKSKLTESDAPEITTMNVLLDFTYNLIPQSSISFYVHAAPGIFINSDLTLKSSEKESKSTSTESTKTTTDSDGKTTTEKTTTNNFDNEKEGNDSFQYVDNLEFGYRFGGGIEYRQDLHVAYGFQADYVSSNLSKSTFDAKTGNASSSKVDKYEGFVSSLVFRYYM